MAVAAVVSATVWRYSLATVRQTLLQPGNHLVHPFSKQVHLLELLNMDAEPDNGLPKWLTLYEGSSAWWWVAAGAGFAFFMMLVVDPILMKRFLSDAIFMQNSERSGVCAEREGHGAIPEGRVRAADASLVTEGDIHELANEIDDWGALYIAQHDQCEHDTQVFAGIHATGGNATALSAASEPCSQDIHSMGDKRSALGTASSDAQSSPCSRIRASFSTEQDWNTAALQEGCIKCSCLNEFHGTQSHINFIQYVIVHKLPSGTMQSGASSKK